MSARVWLRRAYEPPTANDGYRVLVDRLWPRGVSRKDARLDEWARDVAPSDALRRWYDHRIERWPEFRRRYLAELVHGEARPALDALARVAARRRVTLVFGARDPAHSHAAVLRDAIEAALGPGLPAPRPDVAGVNDDLRDDERADLQQIVRRQAAGRAASEVLLEAFLPSYLDARTAGLCHEGASEVFADALPQIAHSPSPRSRT